MRRDTDETDLEPQNYRVRKCSRPYRPEFARQAEKLTLLGATRAELSDLFAVDELTMERWCLVRQEFRRALEVKPTALSVTSEDIGLFNWLKDHRRGDLGI